MYQLQYKTQFKKDLKRIKRRSNSDFELTKTFIKLLQEGGINNVPAHNKPHALIGNYKGHYEAHIKPDLLIIWKEYNNTLVLELIRGGTHSDLF